MESFEIVATFTSYKNDEGVDHRTEKKFVGSVKDLRLTLVNVPVQLFSIHFYRGTSVDEFLKLAEQLVKCQTLIKPYLVAQMY